MLGCQSGVMEKSTPVTSEVRVRFPVEAGFYVIEWATLFDSVGLLRGLRFPPTEQQKSPNIVHRANNVLVDLSSILLNQK